MTENQLPEWEGVLPPPAPAPFVPLTPFVATSKELPGTVQEEFFQPVVVPAQIPAGPPAHQNSRINPDNPKVLILAVVLVFILMVSSFIVSFFGIWGVSAETTNLPTAITWLPALFLDAAILAYTISYFVFRARSEPVIKTRVALWVFALLSVGANIAHTLDGVTPEMSMFSVAIGLAITGSAPIAVVLSTEEIARLAFQHPRPPKD